MAYTSMPYSPRSFYSGYRGGPYGQSITNLFRPTFNNPGGYQPLSSPLSSAPLISQIQKSQAPLFTPAAFGGTGVKGAPTLGAGGGVANAGPGGKGGGAYGGDPALKKADAYAEMMNAQAQAAALAAMKTNLIRFGDPDMVQRVLGGKVSTYHKGPMAGQNKGTYKFAGVQKAAAGNSFSTTQELGRWNDRSNTGINEQRNQQGLFYSSARARDLALQGEDYLRNKAKAANDLQDAISAIQAQLLAAQQQTNMWLMAQHAASAGGG